MIGWVKRHHKKIRDIGVGLAIFEGFNFVYDWLFYPFALWYWGLAIGAAVVTVGSLVINVIVFAVYEYMAVDWLGAHALRQLEEKENKNSLEKLATWIGKKKTTLWEKIASPIVFVLLTLPIDPVIVAIHHKRKHFDGLVWRDWGLLLAATLAANAWWLIKVGTVIEIVKFVWNWLV